LSNGVEVFLNSFFVRVEAVVARMRTWHRFVWLPRSLALNRVRELGADADVVKNLPLGECVSYNRLDSGVLTGKVF
jgi:hypothetical protein